MEIMENDAMGIMGIIGSAAMEIIVNMTTIIF